MKFQSSQQIFVKFPNIKFHENPFSGGRAVLCGRTEKYAEADGRFSQFCDRTLKRPAM